MNTKVFLVVVLLGTVIFWRPNIMVWSGDAENQAPAVAAGSQASERITPPPLVIDKDAPLLLDEASATDKAASPADAALQANNAACFVCHANFKDESLAETHTQAKLGCIACHGKSYAHRNDENNTTPPEKMYPAESIDSACQECHPSHDVPAAKVVILGIQRGLNQSDPKTIVCTACHGHHRLAQRTVRWDKKTGKLLPRPQ
jgi:hypothetical protein